MAIHTQIFSRAGLLGNPSDAYFGRAIGASIRDFSVRVRCRAHRRVVLRGPGQARTEFPSIGALEGGEDAEARAGPQAVLLAAARRVGRLCAERGGSPRGFRLDCETDIPARVGLAGSSALAIATLRALLELNGLAVEDADLATLALRLEIEDLGIHGGLMDRAVQVYGGVLYMDLARELLERNRGRGRYEPLDPALLPPLFLAWDPDAAAGSESVHNELWARFERGDRDVRGAMEELAALADEGRSLLLAGRGREIGPLMDANFELRARIVQVGEGNRRLVGTARRVGAFAKQAGSGGAVIGTYDGDPARLARLRTAYEGIGAQVITPTVG